MARLSQRSGWILLLIAIFLLTFLPYTARVEAQTVSKTFPETGKTLTGRFFQYWQDHGGLAQQGYPISDVLGEVSDIDGKVYTVQYFERSLFELHPENPAPNDVLLSLLGAFRYADKYSGNIPAQQPSTSNPRLFPETGKTLGGVFRTYWETQGGLAQQGLPLSDEFQEVSDLDGKTYTVQYFERAVFELHPENPVESRVLLSQLGTFRYQQKSTTGGWVTPPSPVPAAIAIAVPPTPTAASRAVPAVPPASTPQSQAQPTQTPAPPAPPAPPASSGKFKISSIYYDGQEYRSEGDEYAAIKNVGSSSANLQGYLLNAGDPGQNFTFPSFTLNAGAEVRVYTNRDIPGSFSFGRGSAIWNNGGDCGYLYDPQGNEVSEYCY
jgi:hypothetical protein